MLGITDEPDGDARRRPSLSRHDGRHPARRGNLSNSLLSDIWTSPSETLYRGLRLEDPGLDGRPLPRHPAYGNLPTLSFSESADVAAYFADSGPLGMPALPIRNTVTGRLGLPDYGYIGTAQIPAGDVLFHWRYALVIPELVGASQYDIETVLSQREVTVKPPRPPHRAPGLQPRRRRVRGPPLPRWPVAPTDGAGGSVTDKALDLFGEPHEIDQGLATADASAQDAPLGPTTTGLVRWSCWSGIAPDFSTQRATITFLLTTIPLLRPTCWSSCSALFGRILPWAWYAPRFVFTMTRPSSSMRVTTP